MRGRALRWLEGARVPCCTMRWLLAGMVLILAVPSASALTVEIGPVATIPPTRTVAERPPLSVVVRVECAALQNPVVQDYSIGLSHDGALGVLEPQQFKTARVDTSGCGAPTFAGDVVVPMFASLIPVEGAPGLLPRPLTVRAGLYGGNDPRGPQSYAMQEAEGTVNVTVGARFWLDFGAGDRDISTSRPVQELVRVENRGNTPVRLKLEGDAAGGTLAMPASVTVGSDPWTQNNLTTSFVVEWTPPASGWGSAVVRVVATPQAVPDSGVVGAAQTLTLTMHEASQSAPGVPAAALAFCLALAAWLTSRRARN